MPSSCWINRIKAERGYIEQDIVELEAEIAEEDAVREELEREVAEL